uniref:Uncharacterized protein n=1 Tax=Peronospora matthiolae TaxID=2874970 RepID=A0AAV1VFQ6_9STRA
MSRPFTLTYVHLLIRDVTFDDEEHESSAEFGLHDG